MTTAIVNPRPELVKEEAGPNQPILADSMLTAWQTIGNSYESLTTVIAPGNAARTVPQAHDHGVAGPGAFVAQAAMRWNGSSEGGQVTTPYFAQSSIYIWASVVVVYAAQETSLSLFGSGTSPDFMARTNDLKLELDGALIPYEFVRSQDPESWAIAAPLGKLAQGLHYLALRHDAILGGPSPVLSGVVRFIIDGAEAWPSGGDQMGAV